MNDSVPVWMGLMQPEDLEFLRRFVLASGSLKQIAAEYGVSYPTVRLRLDRLIAKIEVAENHGQRDPFELRVAGLVADGELSMRTAKVILDEYRNELARKENGNERK